MSADWVMVVFHILVLVHHPDGLVAAEEASAGQLGKIL